MLKITRTNTFEAAHHLPLTPAGHKCKNVHGHSYSVTVGISGSNNELGWIVDTAQVDMAFRAIHEQVDHKTLNDVHGLENPTTENLVIWVWNHFNKVFTGVANINEIGVTIQESPRSTAYYNGP